MKEADVRRYLQQTLTNDGIEMTREAFELFLRLTDLHLSKAMQELQNYACMQEKMRRSQKKSFSN